MHYEYDSDNREYMIFDSPDDCKAVDIIGMEAFKPGVTRLSIRYPKGNPNRFALAYVKDSLLPQFSEE